MTIMIELTPEQEASVAAIANERGVSIQQDVGQMVVAQLSVALGGATPPAAARFATPPATLPAIDDEQHHLHDLLQGLFDGSDALERRPGALAAEPSKARVHDAIVEKYRAQGLQV